MDFQLSDEQKLMVDSVQQFAKKTSPVERFRKLRVEPPGWDKAIWAQMGDLGWLGLPFPEEVGGLGGSMVDTMLIVQTLARSLVPEPYLASVVLAGLTLSELGSTEQHEAVLVPLIEGKISLALAYAEREGRYQPSIVTTRAQETGGRWKVSGEKVWVLNGHAADHLVVSARTAGDDDARDGISLFLVSGDAGLSRKVVHGMDGHYTGLIRLDGCEATLLGAVDEGFVALERALDRGAAMACAEGVGLMHECLDRTLDFLKMRKQFGVPIGTFQALQHRAVDMYTEVEMATSMAILAAIEVDSERAADRKRAVSAAKVQLAESGWFVTKEAIQLHGGMGCTDELDIGLFFKRMRTLQALFGDEAFHLDRYRQSS